MTEQLPSFPEPTFARHSDIDVGREILFEGTNCGRRTAAADRRPHISLNSF